MQQRSYIGSNAEKTRCFWCLSTPEYIAYHDTEWGIPTHDDYKHFEFLILESAQAGLSWLTILKRREGYRRAFADFDPAQVALFTDKQLEELITNPSIIRNRQKIFAARNNAQQFLKIRQVFGSFDQYAWSFVGGTPHIHTFKQGDTLPATSPESDAFSADLKKRGFTFLGSTIMYAHMQATGLINDHVVECWKYGKCR